LGLYETAQGAEGTFFLAIVVVIPWNRGFWKGRWGLQNSSPEMVRYTHLERSVELMYIIHEL
jgi:hypothetical protein